MTTFFVNWQDPESRRWHPVAKMINRDGVFLFAYTHGAKRSENFTPFGNMNNLEAIYVSSVLFPFFANRVMNVKRPEFTKYALWSGFESATGTIPLLLMARMGGTRATDTLQVYQLPERDHDGVYKSVFFSHGIRHLHAKTIDRAAQLTPGERLYPLLDIQNPFDSDAVALRTADPACLMGYVPRYLARDISQLLNNRNGDLRIRVKQFNHDAPSQFQVLCEVEGLWPDDFEPCRGNEYQAIAHSDLEEIIDDYSSKHVSGK